MSQGFSVTPFVLQVGGQDVASLQGTCQAIAEDVADALTAMADSAGHQGLSAALTKAAGQGTRTFTTIWAAYGHTGQGLARPGSSGTTTKHAQPVLKVQTPQATPTCRQTREWTPQNPFARICRMARD